MSDVLKPMDLNKVMIIGRLTRDPETRTIPSGVTVCQISVATSYVYTNQQTGQKVEQSEFHNVVLWRKIGEIAQQYLKKASRVYIEGRLQTRSWEGQDGAKRYRTEIVADNMIMLDSRGASAAGAPAAGTSNYGSPKAQISKPEDFAQPPVAEELPTIQQNEDINVEDIPF